MVFLLFSFLISNLSQNRGSREARPCWKMPLSCKAELWQGTIFLLSGFAWKSTARAGCSHISWELEGFPGPSQAPEH